MAEFGHFGMIGGGVCLDFWGAGPFVIESGGRSYRFEDSDRFGPLIILKNGNPAVNQPGKRSSFWDAHWAWRNQGRRTENDGVTCIHDPLKPTLYLKVGRKNIIVEGGDERGEFIELDSNQATSRAADTSGICSGKS